MARNLTRFNPFRDLTRFEPFQDIDEFFKDFALAPVWRGAQATPRIRIDVSENDQNYLVKADIPGVKKEDIKVSIEGNEVTISAESKEEKEEKEGGMIRSERYYGQQYRSFTLPQDVDEAAAQAKYENGVLQLTLPKKAGTGSKQLTVQ